MQVHEAMAVLLSSWLIGAVFTLCSCGKYGQAAVQFNFSTSIVTVSENGNLPSELSIIKTGQNVMDISFHVIVNPGTARETTDYVANDNDPYVFTSTTRELQIRTTLMTDRAGESVEQFTICLPDQTVFTSMGAEAVEPTCATITIVDDDSVVIGFANTSLEFMEAGGPTQKVCVEVKALGLGLDPFDRVPLNINANDSQVQLSGNSLLFDMGITIRCVNVSVVDNNNIADGDRSVSLLITNGGPSSVPVELYPDTILVNIVDDERVTFTFVPQRSFTVLEGDTIDSLEIQKSGVTTLTFRVMLRVELITKSGSSNSNNLVVNPMTLLFNPSTTRIPFEIQIPDNSLSEMQKQFNITLDRIETTSGVGALVTSGEPITIIVYDNDFEVGFTEERISIPQGSGEVCVAILSPAEVHPSVKIGVSVTVVNSTSVKGNLELETNMVVLNATNPRACIGVKFPNNNQQRNSNAIAYVLQLSLTTDSNSRYNVDIVQSNITITYSSQDSLTDKSAVVAAITVPVVFLSLIGLLISILIIIVIIISRRDKKPRDVYGDMGIQRNDDLPVNDHNIQETSSWNNGEAESTMMTKDPEDQANDQTRPMYMVEERVASQDEEVHQSLKEEENEVSTEPEVQQTSMVEKQVDTDSESDPGAQQKPMAAEEGANNIQQNDSPMVEENLSNDDKQNPKIEKKAPIDAKTTVELQLTNCTGDQMFDKPTNTETSSSRMQDPMLPAKEDDDDVIQS